MTEDFITVLNKGVEFMMLILKSLSLNPGNPRRTQPHPYVYVLRLYPVVSQPRESRTGIMTQDFH